MKFNK
jgi:hypothetical protein